MRAITFGQSMRTNSAIGSSISWYYRYSVFIFVFDLWDYSRGRGGVGLTNSLSLTRNEITSLLSIDESSTTGKTILRERLKYWQAMKLFLTPCGNNSSSRLFLQNMKFAIIDSSWFCIIFVFVSIRFKTFLRFRSFHWWYYLGSGMLNVVICFSKGMSVCFIKWFVYGIWMFISDSNFVFDAYP